LRVAEPDVLGALGDRRRLLVGLHHDEHADNQDGDHDRDQRPGDQEPEHPLFTHVTALALVF